MKTENRIDNEAKAVAMFEADGASSADVAKTLSIGRATASRYRKKWITNRNQKAEEAVSNLDPQTILALAERLEGSSPALSRNLVHLSEGIDNLNKFEPFVLNAVSDVIITAQERLRNPDTKASELKLLGELIYKGYATLYNRPNVEVNINQQQNIRNEAKNYIADLTSGIFDEEK